MSYGTTILIIGAALLAAGGGALIGGTIWFAGKRNRINRMLSDRFGF